MTRRQVGTKAMWQLIAGLLVVPMSDVASADSLTMESLKTAYYLFEPVVVAVALHLDEPLSFPSGDPTVGARERRGIRRRLYLNLIQQDEVLTRVLLGGPGFVANGGGASQVHATLITCLGSEKAGVPESEFVFWQDAGEYEISVIDVESGLESNRVAVKIVRPSGEAARAAQVFAHEGLGALLLVIDREHGEEAIPAFEKLVREYPDTPYGQHARLCLALRQASGIWSTERQEHATKDAAALAEELEAAIVPFTPGNPLRSEALLYLARLRCSSQVLGDPEETLDRLVTESRGGYFAREGKRLLERFRATGHPTDAPPKE